GGQRGDRFYIATRHAVPADALLGCVHADRLSGAPALVSYSVLRGPGHRHVQVLVARGPYSVNNWAFFATVYNGINDPVTAFVAAALAALSAYVTPILRAMIVVYIAGNALVLAM